jgi:hypothetical protein
LVTLLPELFNLFWSKVHKITHRNNTATITTTYTSITK